MATHQNSLICTKYSCQLSLFAYAKSIPNQESSRLCSQETSTKLAFFYMIKHLNMQAPTGFERFQA
jgi:hypothetical protein